MLEECCFTSGMEHRTGAFLGLGVAVSSLCSSGQLDSQEYVSDIFQRLVSAMETLKTEMEHFQVN